MSLENYTQEQLAELALLSKTLAEDKSTRKDFLRLTKKIRPDLPIPELEVEEQTNQFMYAAENKISALEAKLAEKEAREELERRRTKIRESGRAKSREDIESIEKLMLEKKIADHDTAAEYWEFMNQAAKPTPSMFPKPVMQTFDATGYLKNPVVAARENAMAALEELRGRPRPIGL